MQQAVFPLAGLTKTLCVLFSCLCFAEMKRFMTEREKVGLDANVSPPEVCFC